MRISIRLALASAMLTLASTAGASLIGDTVTCAGLVGCSPSSSVVGAGAEFTTFGFSIDIGASSITITRPSTGAATIFGTFTPLTLGGLDDSLGDIVGISGFSTTGTTGFTLSDIAFTAHSVSIDFSDSSASATSVTSFNLVIQPTQQVPEPGSIALIGTGLTGLALRRRKRA